MFKKYWIWLLIGCLPIVYIGSYVAWRRTHLYEESYWELNPGFPRWTVHFGSSGLGYGLSRVFYPIASVDKKLNNVAISRKDGSDLERIGFSLRSIHRRPTSDPKFRAVVARLIKEQGEVLAVIGVPDRMGASYEFFRSQAAFDNRLRELPPTARLIVLANRELPLRGTVDEAFTDMVLAEIIDGSDWVLICEQADQPVQYHGKTHTDLRAKLQGCAGRTVAAGYQPRWFAAENHGDTQGVVPNPDGTVTCGRVRFRDPEPSSS